MSNLDSALNVVRPCEADNEYYQERFQVELRRAENASSAEAGLAHYKLAQEYGIKIRLSTGVREVKQHPVSNRGETR